MTATTRPSLLKKIMVSIFTVFALFFFVTAQVSSYEDSSCSSGEGCNRCNSCGCGAGGCMGPFGCSAEAAPYCPSENPTCTTPGDFCYGQTYCCGTFNTCDDPSDACYGAETCCGSGGGYTHKACVNNACTVVSGTGNDSCSGSGSTDTCGSGNYHLGCSNGMCATLTGGGVSTCSLGDTTCGASHKACVNGTCSLVLGAGSDGCTYLSRSCGQALDHLECVNSTCVEVFGSGTNQCSSAGSSCYTGTHKECVNSTCTTISNPGTDQCSTAGSACSGTSIGRTCLNGTCISTYTNGLNECSTPGGSCTPAVCGNGICEDGEDSNSCFADCGSGNPNPPPTSGGLSNSCGSGATYMGCYTDDANRALPVMLMSSGATRESCVAAAKAAGYKYAGLQYYGQCFAGNTLGYSQVSDNECNTACNANGSESCGGGWRNSICNITPPATCTDTNPGLNQMQGCLFNDRYLSSLYGNAPRQATVSGNADNFTAIDTANNNYGWNVMGGPSNLTDNYSLRWQGTFTFTGGTYQFTAGSDDGLRLYIDGGLVLDRWYDRGFTSDTYTVTWNQSNTSHTIKYEFYENGGGSQAYLRWVQTAVLTPAVDLKITSWATWAGNGRDTVWGYNNSDGPAVIYSGDTYQLSWTSSFASSCTIDGAAVTTSGINNSYTAGGGGWSHTYTLTCTGSGGTVSDTVTVSVPPNPTPPVSSSCSADGTTGSFSWTKAPGYQYNYVRLCVNTSSGCDTAAMSNITTGNTENYAGSSASFTATPGKTYSWWVHTKDPGPYGAWSDVVSGNIDCSFPVISPSPTSLTFAAPVNSSPAVQSFSVTNTGTATLNGTISTNQSWCHTSATSVSLAPGQSSGLITVSLDPQSTSGIRSCVVTISAANATSKTVTVSYTSYGPPVVQVDQPTTGQGVSGTFPVRGYAIPDFGRTLYVELWMASTPTLVVTSQAGQPKYSATFYGGAYASACTGTNAGKPNCPNVGFNYNLDTNTFSNGAHTLTIKAIDDAGNTTTVNVPFSINNIGNPGGGNTSNTIHSANSTCGRIDLSWTAGTNATGYNVFRNTANDSSTATQIVTNTSALSYADTAVTPNTAYYYWVQSVGGSTKVPADTQPITPKACSPTTPNISVSNSGLCESARITWAASSGATGYFVYRNTSNTLTGATKINAGNVTTYIDSSVPVTGASQNYYYWVSANNGGGEDVVNQSSAMPIAVVACVGNLSSSDKDISSITDLSGHVTANSTGDCDGFNLPSSTGVIKSGYVLTFTVNLCNSSQFQDVTSVVVTDQMTNLNKPTASGWEAQYQDASGVWQTFPSSGIVDNLSDPNNPTVTFTFPVGFKVPKATSGTQIRKLTFKAVAAPISGNISTARFRNKATINYDAKSGVAGVTVIAATSYMLYYNNLVNIPDRRETQPN